MNSTATVNGSSTSNKNYFSDFEATTMVAENCVGMAFGFPLLFVVIFTIFGLPRPMKTFHKCIICASFCIIPYSALNFTYELYQIGWLDISASSAWFLNSTVIALVQLSEISMTFVCVHFRSLVMFRSRKDKYFYGVQLVTFSLFLAVLGYSKIRTDTKVFAHMANVMRCLEAFVLLGIMLFCFYQIKTRPTEHYTANSLRSHSKMVRYLSLEIAFQSFVFFRLTFRAFAHDEHSFAYYIYYNVVLIPLHTLPIWRGLLFYSVVKIAKSSSVSIVRISKISYPRPKTTV